MPRDKKYGPSKPKKRKCCGNRHMKKQTNQNSESIASSDETVSAESSCFGTTTSESADFTTRSEQKLQNHDLYKLILDCSSEESGNEEEDKSDSECEESEESDDANLTVETPAGNRILCPKKKTHGLTIVETAVAVAVSVKSWTEDCRNCCVCGSVNLQ
jgi:hypothetical protein